TSNARWALRSERSRRCSVMVSNGVVTDCMSCGPAIPATFRCTGARVRFQASPCPFESRVLSSATRGASVPERAFWIVLLALAVLAIGYRFYSAFLAARVAGLDDERTTPAHELNDGQNYHPTNRWVLFGHHFAAISGAGPLVGPVLAAQFGY